MLPTREKAEELLKEAEKCNPGPWGNHSRTAAHCAEKIAQYSGLDPEKAYIIGLLHDIGRKFGKRHLGHVSDGYSYMMSLGYDEAARICLTHSFKNGNSLKGYVGKIDTTEEETKLILDKLKKVEFDDYDRLIQLCDAISGADGVMDIVDRMSDVKRRYGSYDQEKWDANIALKESFEKRMGRDLYEAVEKDTFKPDPMNFTAFVNDIIKNKWNVYGTEVYRDGVLLHSFGDTTENLHELYSATKTILSIAVGIAYDEGLFDLNKCILDYLPEKNLKKMSEKQVKTFEKITIHRLLTMSVGDLPFRAEGESWLDFSIACEIKNPEEKVFNYSNINSYLVGVALTNALGKDLGEFIEERLLRPLDITRFEYTRCPDGYFYGASGMKLTVHDLSKFGLLLMNKGSYNGQRIVSEKYVEMATSIQQMNREGGYGYFIWKYRDGYSINGKLGQKCYILPNSGIIVTYLSNIEDSGSDLKDSMEKWLIEDYSCYI